MARAFESFAKGVSLGLDLGAAYQNTRALFDDRAMRAKADQVAQETANAMKQINAPVEAARSMALSYAQEVMADPSKRDPAKEHTLIIASAQAQQAAVMNRLDYGMNVIASNPGNKYVEASMTPMVQASLDQMENFRLQMAQQENTRQQEAERTHETGEREGAEFHQANMEVVRQQGDYSREEQRQGNRMEYLGEQDRLIRERADAGIGEKGGKKGSTASKFLDDLDFAETRANDAAQEIPEEEWARLSEEAGVDVTTYQNAWKKSKTRRELNAAGYQEEQLNAVFGSAQDEAGGAGAEAAGEEKPGSALLGRIGELLESKHVPESRKKALRKKQESILAEQLVMEGSADVEDSEKILGLGQQVREGLQEEQPGDLPGERETWRFLDQYFLGDEDERRQARFKTRNLLKDAGALPADVPHVR